MNNILLRTAVGLALTIGGMRAYAQLAGVGPLRAPLGAPVAAAPSGGAKAKSQGLWVVEVNPPGSTATVAWGINDSNTMVGWYTNSSGVTEGFEWLGGDRYKVVAFPGNQNFTRAFGVNNDGTVVGFFAGDDGFQHGFLLEGVKYRQYDVEKGVVSTNITAVNNNGDFAGVAGSEAFVNVPGKPVVEFYAAGTDSTAPFGMNNLDEVVGGYTDTNGVSHGFYRDASGDITTVDYPNASFTYLSGINDAGTITGVFQPSSGPGAGHNFGFIYSGGEFQPYDISSPGGINNYGTVSGTYSGPDGSVNGVIAQPGTFAVRNESIPHALDTSVFGTNDYKTMVGYYTDSAGVSHGMMLANGNVTKIDDPSGSPGTTQSYSINQAGIIVGVYTNSSGAWQGFTYSSKAFADIGPAGATASGAFGINDAGLVSGTFVDVAGMQHGYIYNPTTGSYTQLDVPEASATLAYDINDAGVVTLQWLDTQGYLRAATYDGSVYTAMDVPGAPECYVHAINNSGDIVYSWIDYAGNFHSAAYANGEFFLFDYSSDSDSFADGINDAGMIVGAVCPQASGECQSFIGQIAGL
jgi:probable HAF family extracellular repeat protein